MDVWFHGWMEGWMGEKINGQKGECVSVWMDKWLDGVWKNGWMGRWMVGGYVDGWVGIWVGGLMDE